MSLYLLYRSDQESSLSFFLAGDEATLARLPSDAELIWSVEAKSWEVACLKRNEFLGWAPYKPQIDRPEDLQAFIPKDKFDEDNARLLINLGHPEIAPVLFALFEWVQDVNWPVARVIAPFLASLGTRCQGEIRSVFASTDGMWKYWVIQEIIGKMANDHGRTYIPDLLALRRKLTESDRAEEVHIAIEEVLAALE